MLNFLPKNTFKACLLNYKKVVAATAVSCINIEILILKICSKVRRFYLHFKKSLKAHKWNTIRRGLRGLWAENPWKIDGFVSQGGFSPQRKLNPPHLKTWKRFYPQTNFFYAPEYYFLSLKFALNTVSMYSGNRKCDML